MEFWLLAAAAVVAPGCATVPPVQQVAAPPVNTRVMVYPARGQSPEQLDRDRYECHLWAVRESGFDPSAAGVPESARVHVEPAPPAGTGTVAGALTGALLGAAVASPQDAGAGAVVGAVAGAAVGTAADQSRVEAAQRTEEQLNRRAEHVAAGAAAYRRAISACLEGRSYTVS
jgi:hypothetical protein